MSFRSVSSHRHRMARSCSDTIALLFCVAFSSRSFAVGSEFSKQPVANPTNSTLTSVSARSDIECVVKCESAGNSSFNAAAYVSDTNVCLMSAIGSADFGALKNTDAVFRKPLGFTSIYTQLGNRTFRVIQQRFKGNLSFARSWTDYENGFGDDTDFWLGLKEIHLLTGNTPRLIRIEIVTWSNVFYVCEYSGFTVGSASTSYTMTFASYLSASSNTSGDSLSHHKGMKFSIMDADNDVYSLSCSQALNGNGGWWYGACSYCNPSGVYHYSALVIVKRQCTGIMSTQPETL